MTEGQQGSQQPPKPGAEGAQSPASGKTPAAASAGQQGSQQPPKASGTAPATDGPGAGIQAFLAALGKPPADGGPAPDPKVSVAFALGWQMSELYRATELRSVAPASADHLPEDLPGLGSLDRAERAKLALDQVDVALTALGDRIKADPSQPSTQAARDASQNGIDDDFRLQVLKLHVALLTTFTAADFKLGKAYGLGRALADTSRGLTSLESLRSKLRTDRIANLHAWISDLTSVLPAHAGHSVNASLDRWTEWAASDAGKTYGDEERAILLLRRQGERWRALLSGEKQGTDLLEIGDYVSAGFGLLKRFGSLAWRFLLPALPLLILIVVLFVGGIVILLNSSAKSNHVTAGIVGLLASAGLTWKGVGGSLGKAAARLERPVWNAELDTAITDAMTLLPTSKRVKGYRRLLVGKRVKGYTPPKPR